MRSCFVKCANAKSLNGVRALYKVVLLDAGIASATLIQSRQEATEDDYNDDDDYGIGQATNDCISEYNKHCCVRDSSVWRKPSWSRAFQDC